MDTITINFKASGQNLTADAHPQRYASNTVNYIQAVFDLDENWQRFDSVRAVWHNDFACISTVLDGDGACTVPHEVLTNLDEVHVNLVGSDVDGEELVDRMTTYPLRVVIIDAHARICGTETAEVTPSQFEQYVAIVRELVADIKDIDSVELNADYTLTISFSDGTETTVGPIRGEQGETGNGIASAVLNDDYTLTLTFTDGTSYTTPSIRGEQGEQGEPGEVTLAQLSAVLPTDTASGAIASFPDGSDLFDYLSCVCDINPLQDLHGYDKPWVGGGGKNLCPNTGWVQGQLTDNGNISNYYYSISSDFILLDVGTYVASRSYSDGSIGNLAYHTYNTEKVWQDDSGWKSNPFTIIVTEPIYIRFTTRKNLSDALLPSDVDSIVKIQLELGSTATTWTPYENICPITGWTGCEVDVAGKNIADKSQFTIEQPPYYTGQYWLGLSESGGVYTETRPIGWGGTGFVYVGTFRAGTYYFSADVKDLASVTCAVQILFKKKDTWTDSQTSYANTSITSLGRYGTSKTLTEECDVWLVASSYNTNNAQVKFGDIQVETGSISTPYTPYQGTTYPVSWQTEAGTVYGGTVDVVTGVLTVDRVEETYEWADGAGATTLGAFTRKVFKTAYASVRQYTGDNIQVCNCVPWKHDYLDQSAHFYVDTGNAGSNNCVVVMPSEITSQTITIVYGLAQAQTYQLTPTQIHALLGTNNVWADCGDTSVTYKADVQRWVEKKLGA